MCVLLFITLFDVWFVLFVIFGCLFGSTMLGEIFEEHVLWLLQRGYGLTCPKGFDMFHS